MILECDTCRTIIDVSKRISWRFTRRDIPTVLQAVHFRTTYKYLEFPILGRPPKLEWYRIRCSGLFKERGEKE